MANGWRIDDLNGGLQLADDLSNLQGLGNEFMDGQQVYDMSEVLNLPMFKTEPDFVEPVAELSSHFPTNNNTSSQVSQRETQKQTASPTAPSFAIIMKAQTSPGRKLNEEALTYLNQSQSYEILLQCISGISPDDQFLKGMVRLGFHDRKYQVIENEKFEEWMTNRPNERLVEIDIPMCFGIHDVVNQGQCSNIVEFKWDTKADTRLFIKINCVSSEFTKGKSGGESGIPLRLQIDSFHSNASSGEIPLNSSGCQIKVFKPKGADRKLKSEKQKHENLPKEEQDALQPSYDVTVLKELEPLEVSSIRRNASSSSSGFQGDASWLSPCSSQFSQLHLTGNLSASTPLVHSPSHQDHQQASHGNDPSQSIVPGTSLTPFQTLIADSTVEETQRWLRTHRFHSFQGTFSNFKGSDLLMLTRNDLIQLCGPADGIRLHNTLQARASRPLLTMYVSPEWQQGDTGMKEYHAIFLEHLNIEELKKGLASKCHLDQQQIYAVYKQGPTGILICVDDEMIRNFMDEAHHIVQALEDATTGQCRLILK